MVVEFQTGPLGLGFVVGCTTQTAVVLVVHGGEKSKSAILTCQPNIKH